MFLHISSYLSVCSYLYSYVNRSLWSNWPMISVIDKILNRRNWKSVPIINEKYNRVKQYEGKYICKWKLEKAIIRQKVHKVIIVFTLKRYSFWHQDKKDQKYGDKTDNWPILLIRKNFQHASVGFVYKFGEGNVLNSDSCRVWSQHSQSPSFLNNSLHLSINICNISKRSLEIYRFHSLTIHR